MFKLDYKILGETKKELMSISSEEFDDEYGDVEGQIMLSFNEYKLGFAHDEFPFGDELLIFWFRLLNEVLINLKSSNYVAFRIPETDIYWIELISDNNILYVTQIQDKVRDLSDFITTKPFSAFRPHEWFNIQINKSDFITEVIKKTEDFIKEVYSINTKLLSTKTLVKLIAVHQEAKHQHL